MYARFIPPLPGQTPPQRREATPPPQSRAITEVSGTGFGYSRYIPGATSQIQRDAPTIVRFDDEPSSPKPKRKRDQEGEPEEKLKGQKRSKKDKKVVKERQTRLETLDQADGKANGAHTRENADSVEGGNKEAVEHRQTNATLREDVEMSDRLEPTINNAAQAPKPEAQKAKKKEKKKRIKQKENQANEQEAVEEAVEEEERHKAVLERKVRSLKFAETTKNKAVEGEQDDDEQPVESHDLEPLPQPEPAPVSTEKPSYDILPPWLSAPIRVSQDTRASFTHLGILPKAACILGEKGYAEAFAVQTAALPLLLPNGAEQPGDLLISAATGSGKTLAYALPVARDLSNGVVTRLRALVVLPTRELVKQAQEVFEICARAYEGEDRKRVRIGIAIGSQSLSSEQESLMTSETRHDPDLYRKLEEQEEERRLRGAAAAASNELDDLLPPSSSNNAFSTDGKTSRLGPWEGQVVDFYSKVDVLICTPGRLVEHMEQTPGFTLDFVRWLIVDEADKLLAQSFQGWLDVVLEAFKAAKFSARDFRDMAYTGVRKVVLSATLTRDLSLLTQLALRRPRLIVLEGEGEAQGVSGAAEHSLPKSLKEFAVRVHDANLKPLYLVDLLGGQEMRTQDSETTGETRKSTDLDDDARDDTSSDESSSDDTSSEDSDSDSDSDSDDTSSEDTSSEEEEEKELAPQPQSRIPMSLIFTKSNESALRLSRLLTLLDASLTGHMSTLTSNTPTSIRRKTLAAFAAPQSALRLIIASDLVARGIDIPRLAHVINYDLPPSVAGYVHRVGRTARAGRSGCAWTLVGDAESGWFWGKIAKGAGVKRAHKVERVRIEEMSEQRIEEYEEALDKLGKEVMEPRRR